MSDDARRDPPPRLLIWGAILGAIALARAFAGFDPFPAWGGDPVVSSASIVTYTPAWTIAFDLLLIGASAGVVLSTRRSPHGSLVVWTIALLASLVALLHAGFADSFRVEALIAGSSWASSILAAAAGWHASCLDPRARRLLVAILMGAMGPLAMKASLQLSFEHPATVAAYFANKAAFLEAQGWLPDSPMALAYERRLLQAEPSGWFGLANVYATLMLTMSLVFLGLLITAWRHKLGPRVLFAFGLVFLAPTVCVVLAGSKGGIGALLVGLALYLVVPQLRRVSYAMSNRLAAILGLACVGLPLAAVLLRGLVGERLAELSLLFRWFYMQGAARIFADHWPLGVGPAGFRDAYVLVKNPLAPEDPISPHSILFDWGTGLGLAGVALGVLLLVASARAAQTAVKTDHAPPPDPDDYWESRLGWLAIVGATIAGLFVERAMTTPESAITRLLGLIVSLQFTGTFLRYQRLFPRHLSVAIAIALLACVTHLQIEMSATTIGAATWILLFLGVGASRTSSTFVRARPAIAASILALGALLAFHAPRLVAWERALREAHAPVAPIADLGERLSRLNQPNAITPDRQALALELSDLVGRAVTTDDPSLAQAFASYSESALALAANHLARAHERVPSHLPTAQALARVRFHLAQRLEARGGSGALAAALEDAEHLATRVLSSPAGDSSQAHAWMAQIQELLADRGDPSRRGLAVDHLVQATAASPYDPMLASRLARAYARAGRTMEAAAWAERAIRLHQARRLDPLSGLPERDVDELKSLLQPARDPG